MADVEKTEFNLPAGKGPGRGGAHAGGRPTDSAIDANAQAGDNDLETNLRPKSLEEFIGQPKVRNQLDLVLTGGHDYRSRVRHQSPHDIRSCTGTSRGLGCHAVKPDGGRRSFY